MFVELLVTLVDDVPDVPDDPELLVALNSTKASVPMVA